MFSQSLGEWVVGAILYFAKDFRRLLRSQAEGRWDPFEVVEISGQTVGIVGYGDIGRGLWRRGPAPWGCGGARADPARSRSHHPDDLAEQIFAPADRIRMISNSATTWWSRLR